MICGYCGTELPDSALFCGECGRSLAQSGATSRRRRPVTLPPAVRPEPVESAVETDPPVVEPDPPVVEPAETAALPEPPVVEPAETAAPVETPAPAETPIPPTPPSTPTPRVTSAPEPDLEATRIVPPGSLERFVLQFSTGESVTVTGNGLIGRNPVAEPGEYFDHLVTIVDPGKSVSKTHLEFGQDAGGFWVSDRFSGNGSIARQPDGDPVRCDAGKRYQVRRGTRVSIGEQFFVIS